jgi:hypothetical protein
MKDACYHGWTAAMLPLLLVAPLLPGCEREEERPVPSAEEVARFYEYEGELSVEISGNVAQISVTIDPDGYARGGDLWAKAFPYIFAFSPATREAFQEHRGLGGVRILTLHPNGDIMAQALLERGTLTPATWRRALEVAGQARREGTERPGLMGDLVRWGEDHTDFQYNPEYISSN